MTSAPAPDVRYSLGVPQSWLEVDCDPATRESSLEALIEGSLRDVPELREHRTQLARLLRRQARASWDAGIGYCATMVEPTEDGPVLASAVVAVLPAPAAQQEDALSAVLLTSPTRSGQDGQVWRTAGTVELDGAGLCVRTQGVEDVDLPDGSGTVRTVIMQTFVALPQNRLLVLTCSSPALSLEAELLELFGVISDTLEVDVHQDTTGSRRTA